MDVVLVPGFMTDEWLWNSVSADLCTIGELFYADLSLDESIHAFASRTLSTAPEHFLLVGFSMGGYVAREIARLAPDRACGLVLIATSCRAEEAKRSFGRLSAPSGFTGLSRQAVLSSLDPVRAVDEPMVSAIRAMGVRLGAEVFARQSSMRRGGDRNHLSSITCPTLIVAARRDQLRSLEEARELLAGIRNSTLVIIEESGHMIPLEASQELVHVIRSWWDDRLASGAVQGK